MLLKSLIEIDGHDIAPQDDEQTNDLLREYHQKNITGRAEIRKMLRSEGIMMR